MHAAPSWSVTQGRTKRENDGPEDVRWDETLRDGRFEERRVRSDVAVLVDRRLERLRCTARRVRQRLILGYTAARGRTSCAENAICRGQRPDQPECSPGADRDSECTLPGREARRVPDADELVLHADPKRDLVGILRPTEDAGACGLGLGQVRVKMKC